MALHGLRWQRALATDLGVACNTIQRWMSEERGLTTSHEIFGRLDALMARRRDEIEDARIAAASTVERFVGVPDDASMARRAFSVADPSDERMRSITDVEVPPEHDRNPDEPAPEASPTP